MRIPIESSELDQIVRETPSHVGSCVLVIDLSSMVLKIEHIVALQNVSGGHIACGRFRLRNTEQEDKLLVKELHKFLNKESNLDPTNVDLNIEESEEVNLDQLTDELVQVFLF